MRQESAVCLTFNENYFTVLAMLTLKELLSIQQPHYFCQRILKLVQKGDSRFTIDDDGLIYNKAPIDDLLQVIEPEALCQVILYNGHHPITAGHSDYWQMYDDLRRQLYWLYMASNVYNHVDKCESFYRQRLSQKNQWWMRLFPPSRLLELVAINILQIPGRNQARKPFGDRVDRPLQ